MKKTGRNVITLSHISKSFGSVRAVDAVSAEISKGQIFGIVGPDGAGKSTLLRILASVMKPDAGSVRIDGTSIFENPISFKKRIAYMPQRFGLYEDFTVEENIYFFGRIFSVSKRDIAAQCERLYEFSGLLPFKDRLAGKLSGGMKQKLGLACCLVHRPEIVLLDEPTNGVDPVSRREFWKILYELLTTGVTIVVSTAYLDEAERCNNVALMYRGSFFASGLPCDIKAMVPYPMHVLRTSNPLRAQQVIAESKMSENSFVFGKEVRVFLDERRTSITKISALLRENSIDILQHRKSVPTLEDCFLFLTEREKP